MMTRLTAAASLKNATHSLQMMNAKTSRLTVVAGILFASFSFGVLSFILLFAGVFESTDARNALGVIGILSFLLTLAAAYSMAAVTWNCYWLERSKRVAAEVETRELINSIVPIVDDSIREAVDAELQGKEIFSKEIFSKEMISMDIPSLVRRLQHDAIVRFSERAAEISHEPEHEEQLVGTSR